MFHPYSGAGLQAESYPFGSTTAARPIRLGLPWQMPFYLPLNGSHPLVESFLHGNTAVEAFDLDPYATASAVRRAVVMEYISEQVAYIDDDSSERFMAWLDVNSQFAIEGQSARLDSLFLHTTPLYAGTRPFLFHFESLPSLFMPFMFTGNTSGIDLTSKGYFKLVRKALESDQCLRIFSHLRSSVDMLCRVFDSPVITSKCHHVPLGIRVHDAQIATAKFNQPRTLRILFTNSLHNNPDSFYLRGGHHLLTAFERLRKSGMDIALTVLSAIPDSLPARFTPAQLESVDWIDERVDDAALEQLFLSHHLFALPAAGLHSHSLMRAFAHGCVPILSDAPGYEEYTQGIEDSVLTMRGVRSLVYTEEKAGWISDRYEPFTAPLDSFARQIHDLVLQHSEFSHLRDLALRNLEHCRRNFNPDISQAAFNALLPRG
jgi:hypothetical protein